MINVTHKILFWEDKVKDNYINCGNNKIQL